MAELNPIDLDLDALAPAQVTLKYKQQLIEVTPPSLAQFAKIYALGDEMSKLSKGSVDDKGNPVAENIEIASLIPVYEKVKALIDECIPGLANENLNPSQLMSIFGLLANLSTPADKTAKELEDKGITLKGANDPKAVADPASTS